MHEVRRQQYLQTLGIDSYIPRVLLSCAPAPLLCDLPAVSLEVIAQDSASSVVNESASLRAEPARVPVSVAQVLGEMRGVVSTQIKPGTAISIAPAVPREPIKPVHLHLWRPAPDLMVIDDCPPGVALPTHTLLANIVRAVHPGAEGVGQAERMRCPIQDHLAQVYVEEDMRLELSTWFAMEYLKTCPAHIWLMGKEAARYLLPSTLSQEDALWSRQPLVATDPDINGQLTGLVLPSLSELLETPLLKARLWQLIRPQ